MCLAALLTTGCTVSGTDRSGGSTDGVVLVMASNDGDGLDGAPAVARFVKAVATRSDGAVQVRVEPGWRGGSDEARVVRDVAAGDADLGWAGTRVLDLVGVDAFRPLQAPFLITSHAAEAAVVRSRETQRLLRFLRPLGLTGLAVVADELRFPAAAEKPVLRPEDFAGLDIYTAASGIQAETMRALKAVPTSGAPPQPPETRVLGALETMWWTYGARSQHGLAPFVTANAILWPRTVAIFGNPDRLGRLDPRSRRWVRQAARDAVTWSASHAGDRVAQEARLACRSGALLAEATPSQLAALRESVDQVYAALRGEPGPAETLARIEGLVAGKPPVMPRVPAGCLYQPGDESRMPPPVRSLTGPGRTGGLPPGRYRLSLTEEELLAHGLNDHDAHLNAGTTTWTLHDGHWDSVQQPLDAFVERPTCHGWYDVQGATASFTTTKEYAGGTCAPPTWSARWTSTSRQVTWSAVSVTDFAPVWAGRPWRRLD